MIVAEGAWKKQQKSRTDYMIEIIDIFGSPRILIGVIDIEKDMSPALKRKAVKHETDHLKQMKTGEMRFDHNNYYYRPTPYAPIQVIPSSKINPHDRSLPWEKDAHK